MNQPIDWHALADQLGLLGAQSEGGSDHAARQALELILGEATLRDAVDYYVRGDAGSELARAVLWLLHPWSAQQQCYTLFRSTIDLAVRRRAVELLRVVADERALGWVGEFLSDPDGDIQVWGVGVLDQLLWGGLVDAAAAEPFLVLAERHANPQVRDKAAWLREGVSQRRSGKGTARSKRTQIAAEYQGYLREIEAGAGGEITLEADDKRQTVKNRLKRAAEVVGREIVFVRNGPDVVRFRVSKELR